MEAVGAKRVVGIAGDAEKCRHLVTDLSYYQGIDYANDDLDNALDTAFPEGVDLYFDSVGGPLLGNVLGRLRRSARIVIYGSISGYLVAQKDKHRFINLQNLGRQGAKMEGLFVSHYEERCPECIETLSGWIRATKLNSVELITHGIKTMPDALADLYVGNNVGVRMVRIEEPN